MLKTFKKLRRAWPRKKRRKRITHGEQSPSYYYSYFTLPPPQTYHCRCSYHPISDYQPSAPPLPPWMQPEQTITGHETISEHGMKQTMPEVIPPSTSQFKSQEITEEPVPKYPSLPVNSPSYQQYLAPNPVHEVVPVVEVPRKRRTAWFLGSVVGFGVNLIRCFCPCFSIREVS